MSKLTPSQSILYEKIISETSKFARIQNYLLVGSSGNGKTHLLRYISKHIDSEYINFENEFGIDFFQKYDYRVIDENIFLKYISENIDFKYNNKLIMIDELNGVLSSIYQQRRIINLISGYMTRAYRNKYLISINGLYLSDIDLMSSYENKIFALNYTEEDNKFISQARHISSVVSENYKNAHYFRFAN